MTLRKVPLLPGEYFHIYNRGNNKQEIFLDDEDRNHFIKLLYLSNSSKNVNFRDDIVDKKIDTFDFKRGTPIVSIGAWVLMPNHFHLYITSPTPGVGEEHKACITLFMHKLCMSYAKYFNAKYKRTGGVYEGPFKSIHITDDIQAKYLFSYIHLNPVKLIDPLWKENGIKDIKKSLDFLLQYKWSSYHDHRGISRKENKILDLENFPEYFSTIKNFDSEILSWLNFHNG